MKRIPLIFLVAITAVGMYGFATSRLKPLYMQTSSTDGYRAKDISVGKGKEAGEGDTVAIHYKSMLEDGTTFDDSYAKNAPLTFTIGEGSVIKGIDEGVRGMRVGGKRVITIPPQYGYGSGEIFTMEVELIDIET